MAITKTIQELAQLLGGEPEGELSKSLTAVAPLATAGASDLAFLDSDQQAGKALHSRAGCILARPGVSLSGKTVIRVVNPRFAAALAVSLFHPAPPRQPGIHPTTTIAKNVQIGADAEIGPQSVIGEGSIIGDRTSIGAGCVIGPGCTVGDDCILYPRVTLYRGVQIGSRVILHSGCVIGSDGFGYVMEQGRFHKFPQVGTVEIADDVEIGANSTVDRGALGATRIGPGTKIDNLVQIAHNVQIGRNCVIASLTGISGSVVIEDYVVIAGQVGIGDHAHIEKGAVLGGQCGILPHKIVRAGQTVCGTPARPLKDHLAQQAVLARLHRRQSRNKSLRTDPSAENPSEDI